jgi:nucleoside-diphosphate-sugar epimerase
LVTGATGFIGGALVLELLAETDRNLLCLVRPQGGVSAEERLREALREAAHAYDRTDLLDAIDARCEAVPGDLSQPEEAVKSFAGRDVDTVWHVAASLNFHERARSSTIRQNVDGTRTVLEMGRDGAARHHVQFSTAYVAGIRTGTILEQPAGEPEAVNNPYEESKVRAEMLVAQVTDRRTWICRPSIVIGNSRTLATLSTAGIYDSVSNLDLGKRVGLPEMLGDRPLHVVREPSSPVNLIPVDAVVRNAMRIRFSQSDSGIFHLTNSTPPRLDDVSRVICEALDVTPPVYVDSEEPLIPLEKMLKDDPRNQFWEPYLNNRRDFDLTNTDAVVGPEASTFPLDDAQLRPYIDWFVENRLSSPQPS